MKTPYGVGTPEQLVSRLVSRPFDASKHFIPFMPVDRSDGLAPLHGKRAKPQGDGLADPNRNGAEEHLKKAPGGPAGRARSTLAIEQFGGDVVVDRRGARRAHSTIWGSFGGIQKGERQKALQMLSKSVMVEPEEIAHLLKNLAALALEVGEAEDAIGLYGRSWPEPRRRQSLLVVGRLCEQSGADGETLFVLSETVS